MAAIIRIKRSTGQSAPGSLKTGELSYSAGTGTPVNGGDRLYFGKGDDGTGIATTVEVIGGAYFANILDHTPGTLTASSAIIVDASSKIDNLKVDNLDFNGNTISSTDTNGNINITPNGSGKSIVSNLYTDASTSIREYIEDISGSLFVAGEGIDLTYSDSNDAFTIDAELATYTNRGVARFDSNRFVVTSGAVTSRPITIGTTSIELGTTTTTLGGMTQLDVGNIRVSGNTIASTSGVIYIDPDPIDSNGGELVIRGNLTVQGKTTTVNSTTLSINDKNIVLADSATTPAEADGAGITINGPAVPASILYDGLRDHFDFNKAINFYDSIGGIKSIYFNNVVLTEALEDHLVTNFFRAGEGIDLTYLDSANTLTVSAELATTANPGVANFDSSQFIVTAGLVSIAVIDGGVY